MATSGSRLVKPGSWLIHCVCIARLRASMSWRLRWITSSRIAAIELCSGIKATGNHFASHVTRARQRSRTVALGITRANSMAGKATIEIQCKQRWFFFLMWDFAFFCFLIGLVSAEQASRWLAKYGYKFQIVSSRRGRGVSLSRGSRA